MKFFFWDREVIGAPTITRRGGVLLTWVSPEIPWRQIPGKMLPSLQYGNFEAFLEGFPNSSDNVGILERQSQR